MVVIGDENCAPPSSNVMPLVPHLKGDLALNDKNNTSADKEVLTRGKKRNALIAFTSQAENRDIEDEDNTKVGFDTLEAYKTTVDATVEWQAAICEQEEKPEALHDEDLAWQYSEVAKSSEWKDQETGVLMSYAACEASDSELMEEGIIQCGFDGNSDEWKDPATGVIMGYAAVELEHDDPSAGSPLNIIEPALDTEPTVGSSGGVAEADSALQLTVEYQDPCSGVMMGYALCDEESGDLKAASALFAETDEETENSTAQGKIDGNKLDNPSSDWPGSALEDSENESYQTPSDESDSSLALTSEDCDMETSQSDDGEELCYSTQYGSVEWQDPTTGTLLGYDVGEDSEDDAVFEHGVEWQDAVTGTMLGYGSCDQDDEDINLSCEEQDESVHGVDADGQSTCLHPDVE